MRGQVTKGNNEIFELRFCLTFVHRTKRTVNNDIFCAILGTRFVVTFKMKRYNIKHCNLHRTSNSLKGTEMEKLSSIQRSNLRRREYKNCDAADTCFMFDFC